MGGVCVCGVGGGGLMGKLHVFCCSNYKFTYNSVGGMQKLHVFCCSNYKFTDTTDDVK